MYLNKLYSDKQSFNDIEFFPNKLNIILGKRTSNNVGKSVNGVGKTLSLKIIDFCLGSSLSKKSDIAKLEDWEFFLDFSIENKKFTSSRSIDKNKFIRLNDEEYSIKEFNKLMERMLFNIDVNTSLLSYRNLISRFLRIPKGGYNTWNICKEKEQQEVALINNALLLGIDTELIYNKIAIKKQVNLLNANKKSIKNDENIKSIIKGTDIGVNITSLTKEIGDLKYKINSFKISEEYNNIKTELEKSKYTKNETINRIAKLENIISNIDKSLKIKVDVTSEEVLKLYEEASIVFKSDVKKHIEEVSNFHKSLLENRQLRLKEDRDKFRSEINSLNKSLKIIDNKINSNMEYLEDKGTLSEYDSLRTKLNDMELRLFKFKEYDNILSEIDIKIGKLKKDMAEEDIQAAEYIKNYKEKEVISDMFKEFIDYIYKDEKRISGIKVNNNIKNNKLRFEIEPEVDGEKSAGINNVKTFCMDMMYLKLQSNHNIKFIYHDNSIFTETDPRQVYNMLKLAKNICEKEGVQYIINLNYDMYENVIGIANEDGEMDFSSYLNANVVAELCDDSPKNKLLGIDFK